MKDKTIIERFADLLGVNNKFHKFQKDNIDLDPKLIVSPVEARLVDIGEIFQGSLTSKNKIKVSLEELLGDRSKMFEKGVYLNLYLCPKDKHYWRTPYDGKFTYTKTNKGKSKIPICIGLENFFKKSLLQKATKKNASISSVFQTKEFPIAMIAVGSLFVNGIHTIYTENRQYKKGEVCGYFTIGSTMLLCFPDDNFEILINKDQKIDIGQAIARIN